MIATQPESKSPSRRALLAGALGGLGAFAASAIGRRSPVRAGVDGDVVLGAGNSATSTTSITAIGNFGDVFAASSNGADAVNGYAQAGAGVFGFSATGTGVHASSNTGFALRSFGRIQFFTSGVVTIAAGSTSRTVAAGVNVTAGSFVLLTPRANIGTRALWFTTDPANDQFTIRLSSSRSSNTKVAWLLLG